MKCLQSQKCRWLHMCLDHGHSARRLEILHLCKDKNEGLMKHYESFFRALRSAYYKQKDWRERLLYKLQWIDFIEFELCPDDEVGHVISNQLPPTVVEYDFRPAPPLKKIPPIASDHLRHVLSSYINRPQTTSYLRRVPKKKDKALAFHEDEIEKNTGWGLHFVETLRRGLPMMVLFIVFLIAGLFAVCWSIWKKDVQGAFGVAAYVTCVVTLGVAAWQMWAV